MFSPVQVGKRTRYSYARIKEVMEMPHLLDIQRNSYEWFMTEGLKEILEDISPISIPTGNLKLFFKEPKLGEPKYSLEECKERDSTYSAPIRVKVQLVNHEQGDVKEQEVFMGDFPLMTSTGTFIINGAERVIVSQLVRSPGVYYSQEIDQTGKKIFTSTVIPNRGAWIELETDDSDVVSVRIDRTRKLPVTYLLRALGFETNEQIMELFGDNMIMANMLEPEGCSREKALEDIYRHIRPNEPVTSVDNAQQLLNSLFFDPKRYDLASVGRFKLAKKLGLKRRILGKVLADDIVDLSTGEVLIPADTLVTENDLDKIEDEREEEIFGLVRDELHRGFITPIPVKIKGEEGGITMLCAPWQKIHDSRTICIADIVSAVGYMLDLMQGVGNTDDIDHLGNRRVRSVGELLQNQFRIGLARMERVVRDRMTTQDSDIITPQILINIKPVIAAMKEFFGSSQLSQFMDQHNPLSELTHKRRLSALGPGGLSRERAGFEVRDVHNSHYGRMCPIETPEGPNIGLIGSLSNYGRINQYGFIETPYRKVDKDKKCVTNVVDYLTADEEETLTIAQANEPLDDHDWFINERVTARFNEETMLVKRDTVDYMDVSPKQVVSIATAMIPFLENDDANRALMGANMQRQAVPLLKTQAPLVGTGMEFKAACDSGVMVLANRSGTVTCVDSSKIFIKPDEGALPPDTYRLARTQAPFVNEGEHVVQNQLLAKNVVAKHSGMITNIHIGEDAKVITVQPEDFYRLQKFVRSNQGTCINQIPIVDKGEHVYATQPIADGPATDHGELSLGYNILVAYMPWEGYNYEDAILLSENLLKQDIYTSLHIEEYQCDARDTKLGPEEITRDIPNVSEDALTQLDDKGIIAIGADVRTGDILVGKVTPKGETDLTAEERLLRAIFGEKAREVRDTSLHVRHGEAGKVVDVKIFVRKKDDEESDSGQSIKKSSDYFSGGDYDSDDYSNFGIKEIYNDEMPPGVNKQVRVYIAQKRKISVGDKMSGRHGNKGVVSQIMRQEDMPFLPDGTPVDIVLNPLGVPSRMNIGQVLETHLGMAVRTLGMKIAADPNGLLNDLRRYGYNADMYGVPKYEKDGLRIATPVFDGAREEDVINTIKLAGLDDDGKTLLYDGRTGEAFENRVTVGCVYMLKLHHLVDDKIHARSTGPYSLVTQQPLGGKAQFGGQRFGEMEVWALEAYGASYTLQEILTVKSDDVVGRVKAYEAIVKGNNIPEPGVPESFKVLIKELQSIGLDIKVLSGDAKEIVIHDEEEDEIRASRLRDKAGAGSEPPEPPPEPDEPANLIADDYTNDDMYLDSLDTDEEPTGEDMKFIDENADAGLDDGFDDGGFYDIDNFDDDLPRGFGNYDDDSNMD